ncbi:hypothetical protein ACIQ7D_17565 [Streptomyces sp. NPDC096310]|uniref:hypothetical protein n=1 Tax=Streptomyces sp. NPDC096310 TaxID=3366082 RepID=UPI00380B5D5F
MRVLVQHLPPESATTTALRNAMTPEEYEAQAEKGEPEKGRWSQTEQLLAGITDSLRTLEYILIRVNSDGKGRKPKRPEPIRRPGATSKPAREPMSEAASQRLFEIINGGSAA